VCAAFRVEFIRWALANQDQRCAYCGLTIQVSQSRTESVDHVAPKGKYRRWAYEPLNLVLACFTCNSTLKKESDVVLIPAGFTADTANYQDCDFEIVHPYLDTSSRHLRGGWDGTLNSPPEAIVGLTQKGRNSMEMFRLADPGKLKAWDGEYLSMVTHAEDESLPPHLLEWKQRIRGELFGRH
jgi:uncharacterized protein (TIGR02646 family)